MLSNQLASRLSLLALFVAGAVGAAGACSATGNNSSQFQSSGGTGANSGAGSGGSGSGLGGNGFAVGSGAGTTGSGNVGGSCAAEPFQAQQLPLDMYIMQDQSGSMNDITAGGMTKWQAVTSALSAFVQ